MERHVATHVAGSNRVGGRSGHVCVGVRLVLGQAAGDARVEHHDELDELIGKWAAGLDVTEAFHLLQQAGVPAAPLMDEAMFSADPQVRARGWLRPLTTTDVGTHPHPSQPYRGVPQAWRRGSPSLGEDNAYVYREILGVTEAEYARYAETRMLAEDYLAPDGTAL